MNERIIKYIGGKPSECFWNFVKYNQTGGINRYCSHRERTADILECSDYEGFPDECPLNKAECKG